MIRPKNSIQPGNTAPGASASIDSVESNINLWKSANHKPLPNSSKVYLSGELHPDVKVPFREISLAPTKSLNGQLEVNEPVRVYDTSGPWGDASVKLDPVQGLPPLRREWILERGDVQEIEGRVVRPIDDGFLSEADTAHANGTRSPP